MSNQKIKLVPEATSLNFVYGRQNNDIVQVPTSGVSVGGLSLSISSSGLSARSTRCSVTGGGYADVGNLCFVSMRITTCTYLDNTEFWGMVDNFPAPALGQYVPLSCIFSTDNTNHICQAQISPSGALQIFDDHGVGHATDGYNYIVSGFYAI